MIANDATFEAGMAKMNCGNAIIGAAAGVLAADAQVLAGAADLAVNIARSGATAALPHGNSVGSQKAQHVYEILRTDMAGNTEVYKYGISGGALTPGGLSARAEAQVAALNLAFESDETLEAARRSDPELADLTPSSRRPRSTRRSRSGSSSRCIR